MEQNREAVFIGQSQSRTVSGLILLWVSAALVAVIRGNPPPGEKEPGTYLLSYLSDNDEDRKYDPIIPSLHPRPYLQLKKE